MNCKRVLCCAVALAIAGAAFAGTASRSAVNTGTRGVTTQVQAQSRTIGTTYSNLATQGLYYFNSYPYSVPQALGDDLHQVNWAAGSKLSEFTFSYYSPASDPNFAAPTQAVVSFYDAAGFGCASTPIASYTVTVPGDVAAPTLVSYTIATPVDVLPQDIVMTVLLDSVKAGVQMYNPPTIGSSVDGIWAGAPDCGWFSNGDGTWNFGFEVQCDVPNVFGACCIDWTNPPDCQEGVEMFTCLGSYGRFIANGTCDQFDPPCGEVPQIACCYTNGVCTMVRNADLCATGGAGIGDVNCDGFVNFDDINPFVCVLSGGGGACVPGCPEGNADCNQDGEVNFDDINPLVCLLSGGCAEAVGTVLDLGLTCSACPYIQCPPDAMPEAEACGTEINGGCNITPPAWGFIDCGVTVCGTSFFDGANRDTDWYRIDLTADTALTITSVAGFDLQILLIVDDGSCAIDLVYDYMVAGPHATAVIGPDCVPPGTYYIWVGPQFTNVFDCLEGFTQYTVTLACAPCVVPLGACCMPGGACVDAQSEIGCGVAGGTWMGAGITCDTNPCPTSIPGDDCAAPLLITGPYPEVSDATTIGATVDCPAVLNWNAIWYKVTLPYASNDLSIQWCGITETIYTIGIVYYDMCDDCANYHLASSYQFYTCPTGVTVNYNGITGPRDIYVPAYVVNSSLLGIDFEATFSLPIGACCVGTSCVGDMPASACAAAGGSWYVGETCDTFVCPEPLQGDTCADAFVIDSLPYDVTGTTVGYANNYDQVCPYSGSTSPDVVFVYSAAADICVDLSLCNDGTTYDTKMYIFADTCSGTAIACNDDACSSPQFSSYVSALPGVALAGGHDYYIVIDGYGGASGDFHLTINPCPIGACCVAGACVGDTSAAECAAQSGNWFIGETCASFVCPLPPANDLCVNAASAGCDPIAGTTIGATIDDCPAQSIPWASVWYKVDLPYASNDMTVVINGTTQAILNTGIVYTTVCSPCTLVYATTWTQLPMGWEIHYNVQAGPATIYYPAWTGDTSGNNAPMDFTISFCVAEHAPCIITCPGGSVDEGEACGTDTNGGCNSAVPVFGAIACGETICGTSMFDGSTRDTDWFMVTGLTSSNYFTVTAEAEFDLQLLFITDTGNDCVGYTYLLATAAPCTVATIATACLPIDTYYVWVGPQFTTTFACTDGDPQYWVHLDCVDCTPPPPTPGDTCADPIVVNITTLPWSDSNTTCGLNNDYTGTCLGTLYDTGPDLIYALTVPTTQTYRFTLVQGAYEYAGFAISTTCPIGTSCLAFAYAATGNITFDVALTAGTQYYVMVDNWPSPPCTTYTLTVSVPPPPTTNDTCPGQVLTGTVPFSISDTTVGLVNNYSGSCGGSSAPDAVYQWTADANYSPIYVSLCGSSYDTLMYVRSGDCVTGTELACNDDYCSLQSQVSFNAVAGTKYWIFVDGYSGSGAFTLTIKTTAEPSFSEPKPELLKLEAQNVDATANTNVVR